MSMQKYKKNILVLSLASLLLASCGMEETDNNDYEVVVQELDENNEETVELTDEDIFGNKDISQYNLYDDTMVEGVSIVDPRSGEESKYLMMRTHNMIFDKEEYGVVDDFLNDARKCVGDYLTDEEFENSNILVVINTYESIEGNSFLSEKRTIFETPKDGDLKLIVSISRTVIDADKNIGTRVENLSINGVGMYYGAFMDGDEFISLDGEDARVAIGEFNIPTGVYTKDSLKELLISEKGKELTLD